MWKFKDMQVNIKQLPLLNQIAEKGEVEAPFAEYGEVIRIARSLLDLSAEKLSEQSGVAPSTLSKMESSAADIQAPKLLKVFDTLGIELIVRLKKLKEDAEEQN